MHPAPWSIDDIITGERLQAIADVSLATPEKLAVHLSLTDSMRDRVCLMRLREGRLDIGADDLARLKQARVLFVYGDFLELFFMALMPVIASPFVLISHNSDAFVDHRFREYLNAPRLIRWYAQNLSPAFIHPKLVSLPLGLANAQWPHGNLGAFQRVMMAETAERDILLYANFAPETASMLRKGVMRSLADNPATTWESKVPVEQYWRSLRRSRFVAAPRGHGIDTHRLWECFYLGAVPILDAEDQLACCARLPALTTQDWRALDAVTLTARWEQRDPSKLAHETLSLAYWQRLILADANTA